MVLYNQKINAQREKERRLAQRKEELKSQFSSWDGSHRNLTAFIKKNMNDHGSYEHVETVYWAKGDHIVVKTTFRGKNAFGGLVLNSITAKISNSGQVLQILN